MGDKPVSPVARTLLQQCLQARLQVNPAKEGSDGSEGSENSEAQWVQGSPGAQGVTSELVFPPRPQMFGRTELSALLQIERGMVIYICFFKGATDEVLPKMVSTLLNIRLCESDSQKLVSVSELPGNLLIVPQATLGGKVKGRVMQYHSNIAKDDGLRLYNTFVSMCEKELVASGVTVKHGTYGIRQVLKLDTCGPYSHLVDF